MDANHTSPVIMSPPERVVPGPVIQVQVSHVTEIRWEARRHSLDEELGVEKFVPIA